MENWLIRIEAITGVITVCCGLWMADGARAATPQSVESIVQQRMDAGATATESAADAASQETTQPSTPSTPSPSEQPAEPPAQPVQPSAADQPSGTAGASADQSTAAVPSAPTTTAETPTQSESAAGPTAASEPSTQPASTTAPSPSAESPTPPAPPAAPGPEAEAPSQPATAAAPTSTAPSAAEVAQSTAPTAPPTYTVKPGDTLWSISSLHLSDPFNWPKLWNVNPSVANPDLIYPGNVLTLPNGKPVETVQAPAPPVAEAPPAETKPEETAKEETPPAPAEQEAPPPAPEEQPAVAKHEVTEPEAPKVEEEAPTTRSKDLLAQSSGFIAKDLPVTARVVGTYDNRTMLSAHDTIYLQSNSGSSLEQNGRYTVYRRLQQVVHPITRRVIGDMIQILGEVEVREIGQVATGVVLRSFAPIEPGDSLMPARTVEAAPSTPVVEGAGGSLSGLILAIQNDQEMAGQFNVVYIDRGESSGVVVGDHFRVYRRGQRSPAYSPVANVQLPDRQIGELEILNVQGETATAVLTSTSETVALGDRIER
ncbi:MAG TPA: LysM peptidoglycan-binding domain-containing protein [Nitrospiria bacterium]|nr:LysM peptidoglycan-binding domain-containing protein [Nitrospiria bacterium]